MIINTCRNPGLNLSVNPNYNSAINPNFNSSINPNFNSSINPNFSGAINPNFNSSINPNFNSSINPLYNTLINPNYSANFNGFYLWQWSSSTLTGFVVRASNQVLLIYNLGVHWCSFGVVVSSGAVIQFDLNGNWIGTWVSNGCGNYNVYASGMVLTGYTT